MAGRPAALIMVSTSMMPRSKAPPSFHGKLGGAVMAKMDPPKLVPLGPRNDIIGAYSAAARSNQKTSHAG